MIIVTGGAGFIGSAIVAALNKRGLTDILIVDELGSDEKWKNLRKLKYTEYIEKDEFLSMVTSGEFELDVETVFHMGACSSTTETDCSYLVANNYQYSNALAYWADSIGARFIYASSAATYGDGELGFDDDEEQIGNLLPLNMYGYSKQMFDQWAIKTGLMKSIVGLKFFNVFGPNEYHKDSMISFPLRAFNQINEIGKVKLFESYHPDYKDGEQLRDFVYVKDVVNMCLYFMDNTDINGIFNIGTGESKSWNQLAKAVFKAMGKDTDIEYIPMPEHLKGKYQYFTQANMDKLKDFGYDIEATSLDDAVADYVQNYLMTDDYLSGENF